MNHSTIARGFARGGTDSARASRTGIALIPFPTYVAALMVFLALSASASAQTDVYKNTTTYLNNGVANGGTVDVDPDPVAVNLKTLMIADDITVAPGGAGLPINGYSFAVRNFNGVAVSARALITVYADNGANSPGDLLYSVTFAPETYAANSVQIFDFSPGGNLFTVPASGKMWAGLAFDNRLGMLATTQAQLDSLGEGAYGPATLGSSSNDVFVTNAAGNYALNNPVGHLEDAGFSLGWRFSSPNPLPEPSSIAVCGAALVMISRRRRADRSARSDS